MNALPTQLPRRAAFALFFISLLAASACKKESSGGGSADTTEYTLKASFPRVGTTVRHAHKSTIEMTGEVLNEKGLKEKDLTDRRREDKIWKETTLATKPNAEDDWSQLRVVFERYEMDEGAEAPPAQYKLTGRTFLVERIDNEVVFQDENGKRATVEDEMELRKSYGPKDDPNIDREFVAHRDLLPDKPVRVGQTYDLPADKMARSLGNKMPIDADKAVAKGTLKRVYEKDGHRFGEIEVNVTLPAMTNDQITVTGDSKMTVVVQYDGCIDGSVSEATGKVKIQGSLEGKGPRGTFKLRYNANLEISETEVKK